MTSTQNLNGNHPKNRYFSRRQRKLMDDLAQKSLRNSKGLSTRQKIDVVHKELKKYDWHRELSRNYASGVVRRVEHHFGQGQMELAPLNDGVEVEKTERLVDSMRSPKSLKGPGQVIFDGLTEEEEIALHQAICSVTDVEKSIALIRKMRRF